MLEITVYLDQATFDLLKARAQYHDCSISGMIRQDVTAANQRERKEIEA